MTTVPKTDLIIATFSKAEYARLNNPFTRGTRFDAAFVTLSNTLAAGKIWNVEFQDAKSVIADGCEHAQKVSANAAHEWQPEGGVKHFPTGDVRNEIGYAFGMNQAAKLSRNLKKLKGADLTTGIQTYILTLDQIAAINEYLKQFKAIIVKGRKPQVKTEEQIADEISNIGTCCICGKGQKLDAAQGMVHHGYQMSEYNHAGYRMGSCFGVKHLPYEFSCEANKQWLSECLKPRLKGTQNYLARLNASVPENLIVTTYKWEGHKQVEVKTSVAKGTTEYEQQRQIEIDATEADIRNLNLHIEHHTAKVDNWKLTPLQDGTVLK